VKDIASDLALEDRWILSRVAHAAEQATRGLERFRLHEVAEGLYHFFWGEVCDWYLELVKNRLSDDADAQSREAARATLVVVLDHALRLLHPIVPFVTAELWARLPWPEGESRPEDLIIAPWPDDVAGWRDSEAEGRMDALKSLVVETRRLRKEYGVGEGQRIAIHITGGAAGFVESVQTQAAALDQLARVDRVVPGAGEGVGASAVLPNGAELFVPLEGVIDLERERDRLEAEVTRVDGLLDGVQGRLANDRFVRNAPEEIVQKERDKAAQLEEQLSKLRDKLEGLGV
jgi:valyl-tRNA synthetase